jgi:YD repeat-containing protein
MLSVANVAIAKEADHVRFLTLHGSNITDNDRRVTVVAPRLSWAEGGRPDFSSINVPRTASRIYDGGGFVGSHGSKEQETDDKTDKPPCEEETSSNPVVLFTGNKVEPELDFATAGDMGLYLARTYNHHWSATGLFGNHWLSNFDYSLAFSTDKSVAWAQRPDGRRVKFVFDAAANRWNEDKALAVAYIVKSGDSYILHNDERGSETYNADGYITLRRNEQGIAWTFVYSGKYLQAVTHTSGRSVQFAWANGQVSQVTDPAGNVYQYTYTPNVFGTGRGRLASTILPGQPVTTIAYHYEDSRFVGALTGKSFNGVRYSTFAYDADRRATLSEHAGGVERSTFSYVVEATEQVTPPPTPPPPGGFAVDDGGGGWCEYEPGTGRICYEPWSLPGGPVLMSAAATTGTSGTTKARPTIFHVTETNPLGRRTTHTYENGKKVSVSGAPSANCPLSYRELSYDANGYENIVSDYADKLTDFDYDQHGHLHKKVEAAGTPSARTTTYGWDEANNRLTRVTVPQDSETTYGYTADGRLASVTVKNLSSKGVANQVRTTTYAYTKHANGLLATMVVDGPLANDTVTSTFSQTGDLLTVQNSLGHTTTLASYNKLGSPGRVTGSNGDVTEYTYDARGRVTAVSAIVSGAAQTTSYTYDGAGRIATVRSPDGVTLTRQYDPAGRLVREYYPEFGGTFAVKKYAYNNASLVTSATIERTTAVTKPSGAPGVTINGNGANGNYGIAWSAVGGTEYYVLEEQFGAGAWVGSNQGLAGGKSFTARSAGTYNYRVKACNAEGCNTSSIVSVVSVYPPTTNSTVSAPAQVTNGSFSVSWTSVAGATSYKLQESAKGGAWTDVSGVSGTSKAISGKTAGTYDYRVYGCNLAGCGPVSASVRVIEIDPPTGVATLTAPAINTTGSYSVSWTAVSGATSYQLDESSNGGATWAAVTGVSGTSKAFTGKSTATEFRYRARACNAAGCGGNSAVKIVQKVIYNSQVTAHTAPTNMLSGQTTSINVTLKNTGNMPWTIGSGRQFYLGKNYAGYRMPDRIAISSQVNPGQSVTFSYTFTAPVVSGPATVYQVGGQMIGDAVGWFGPAVPAKTITVENPTETCPPNEPYCVDPWSVPVDPAETSAAAEGGVQ